jgi:hypothetical protein
MRAAIDAQQAFGDDTDWVGRLEAARCLSRVAAGLPAGAPSRTATLALGGDMVQHALACGDTFARRGTGAAMIAVMRGNTHQVALQLARLADDPHAAAVAAGEVTAAFAVAHAANANERNQRRVVEAAAEWLAATLATGDAGATDRAVAAARDHLAAAPPAALAELAAIVSATDGAAGAALDLLRAAVAKGLPAATLADARFARLRAHADFTAIEAAASGR